MSQLAARAAVLLCAASAANAAEPRIKADVQCQPSAGKLQYDCILELANARTSEPLNGATVRVGADMPSMAMAHNVRPVAATAGPLPGTYRARITLEMFGDWALRIDVSGPIRDRLVKIMRFEPGSVRPSPASR